MTAPDLKVPVLIIALATHRKSEAMNLGQLLQVAFVLSLIASTEITSFGQETPVDSVVQPPPKASVEANVARPMAAFARLIKGEWKQTAASGTSMFHRWYWGPGKHSIRRMTDGEGADGKPWYEVQVYFWDPNRMQVRMLGVSPYDQGVSEGTIHFEKGSAEGTAELYQARAQRKMGVRWQFEGQDKYRETLLEAVGSKGLEPLVEFDLVRIPFTPQRPRNSLNSLKLSNHLKNFEAYLGHTWVGSGEWSNGDPLQLQTSFDWIPVANAIYVRVSASDSNDGRPHLLDAYIYHHTKEQTLKCLALLNAGGVFEGDVSVGEGGTIQIELKNGIIEKSADYSLQFEIESPGILRERAWFVKDDERIPLFNISHQKSQLRR